jgi:hypothetical protein
VTSQPARLSTSAATGSMRRKAASPIIANTTSPAPPSTAPTALRSARRVPSSCWIRVRLAGRMDGNARNDPPMRAPTALAMIPATIEIAAPSANRIR